MNEHILILPSAGTDTSNVLDEILFFDRTTMTVDISELPEEFFPLSLNVDWGDGKVETIQNKLTKNYRESSILNEVLYSKFSEIFSNTYPHDYYPSPTSLFKSLTATITINYSNFDILTYYQPIKIRTDEFFESVEDVKLLNTKFIDGGKEHQILTKSSGQVLEIRT